MKNPWIRYTLVRLALFIAVFMLFALLDFNLYFAAIIAAVISFAISLIVLDKDRNALSEEIHNKFSRTKDGTYSDPESDLENQLLDELEGEIDNGEAEADK